VPTRAITITPASVPRSSQRTGDVVTLRGVGSWRYGLLCASVRRRLAPA
jgi:hypothetical protein